MSPKPVTTKSLNESYHHLIQRAQIDLAFVVLTMSAAAICAFGFEMNSPAIIVGSNGCLTIALLGHSGWRLDLLAGLGHTRAKP
jgi:hypothetical protein